MKKYKVAYSNPSFELWVLLHFKRQTAFINRHEALSEVKHELPGYEKGSKYISLYANLKDHENLAIVRAKELEKHHDEIAQDTPASRTPSSTMFYLLENLDKDLGRDKLRT